MADEKKQSVYDLIGEDGFNRLVEAFYKRVATDPVLAPMYPEGEELEGAERRLRLFLLHMFGGPDTYREERGQPRLRMRHQKFVITQDARDVWIAHMTASLEEAGLPDDVYTQMKKYFEAAATSMINAVLPE